MTAKELREKRAKLVAESRAVLDKALAEDRDMTDEEETNFNAAQDEVDKLGDTIEKIERQEDAEARAKTGRERIAQVQTATNPEGRVVTVDDVAKQQAEYRGALNSWARVGLSEMEPEQREFLKLGRVTDSEAPVQWRGMPAVELALLPSEGSPGGLPPVEFERDHYRYNWEKRAAQTVTTTGGGHVIGDEPIRGIEEALLAFGGMRAGATVIRTTTGADLPIPTDDDTGQTGELLAINTAAAEQAITFGLVTLQAFKYSSKIVLVPFELMQDSSFDFGSYVGRKLGTRIGRILNTHFTAGTGSSQPNGVKNVANGAVRTVASATAVTADELIDLQGDQDPAYDAASRWMMKKATIVAIRKLKDSNNQYLWIPGIGAREPDTLLGKAIILNQDVRSIGADKRSIFYGDFGKYWIRDVMAITLLRLVERYAELAQIGFVAFSRHDGDILDAGTFPIRCIRHPAS